MWKKYIKRIMKEVVGVYTQSTSIFFLFLTLVLFLYLLFKIFNLEPQILSAAMTFTLLIITFLYAQATFGIINETKKDRRISFIEKRLEKLYCPLKERLDRFEPSEYLRLLASELQTLFAKYSYLASNGFASKWKEFTKKPDYNEYHLYLNMLEQIKSDITKYEKELHDLTRY